MQQLPLDISPPQPPGFDNYVAGENAEALLAVRALAAGTLRESTVYLWGAPGSGRSHLLAAAQRANPELLIADDVQLLSADGQQALFVAVNAARESGRGVLAAGSTTCAHVDDKSVHCWGGGKSGQIGDGALADRAVPVVVRLHL